MTLALAAAEALSLVLLLLGKGKTMMTALSEVEPSLAPSHITGASPSRPARGRLGGLPTRNNLSLLADDKQHSFLFVSFFPLSDAAVAARLGIKGAGERVVVVGYVCAKGETTLCILQYKL